MILVPGKIAYNDPSVGGVQLERTECMKTCFENDDCILSYMSSDGYCLQYSFSNLTVLTVTETNPDEGYVVAMKANMVNDDSCPELSTISDSLFGSTLAGDIFKWTRTESGWFTTRSTCPAPWKMFQRSSSVTICLQSLESGQQTRQEAVNNCEKNGWKLTGIATVEEKNTFLSSNLWIDGIGNCSQWICEPFTHSDGYTTNAFGGGILIGETTEFCYATQFGLIYAYPCTEKRNGGICGFKLSL